MKDRAGNDLVEGDRVLYLKPGTSTSWLVWGIVVGFTPKMVRIKPDAIADAPILRDRRSVVKPFKE